jgi:hypothetical protein
MKNPDFLERVTGGATTDKVALVTEDLIARVLDVRRVKVGKAVMQTLSATPSVPGTPTDLWTPNNAALIYTGEFETSDLASPAFGKIFYDIVPETGVRYAAWTWLDDEPNTVEWSKAAEYFVAGQVMKSGYLWTNTTQS